jgi:hypothetical protein
VACPVGRASPFVAATRNTTCALCNQPENSTAGAVECWPGVLSATASNPPPLVVGFSVGDTVTILFSSATNTPPVTPALVRFSPSIGSTSATWRSPKELQILVVSVAGVNPASVDVATGG